MSATADVLSVLEKMTETIVGLEETLTKLEQRPRNGPRRRDNQMDLFSGPGPVATPPTKDTDDLARRLDKAMAKIQSVLQTA